MPHWWRPGRVSGHAGGWGGAAPSGTPPCGSGPAGQHYREGERGHGDDPEALTAVMWWRAGPVRRPGSARQGLVADRGEHLARVVVRQLSAGEEDVGRGDLVRTGGPPRRHLAAEQATFPYRETAMYRQLTGADPLGRGAAAQGRRSADKLVKTVCRTARSAAGRTSSSRIPGSCRSRATPTCL